MPSNCHRLSYRHSLNISTQSDVHIHYVLFIWPFSDCNHDAIATSFFAHGTGQNVSWSKPPNTQVKDCRSLTGVQGKKPNPEKPFENFKIKRIICKRVLDLVSNVVSLL